MAVRTLSDLSLPELRQTVSDVYRRGRGSRPDVLLISVDGELAVLKDYGACDPWFARVLGPFLAGRESRTLQRLHGTRGIPALLGRPDSRSLLIEHIYATSLAESAEGTDWRAFFERMHGLLAEMHTRGIAHCDLRSPFNTLIGEGGEPFIVDFVASLSRGRPWNIGANWLFTHFARADEEAMIKLKISVAPELVSEPEHARYTSQSGLERAARWIGSSVRSLSRNLFTRR